VTLRNTLDPCCLHSSCQHRHSSALSFTRSNKLEVWSRQIMMDGRSLLLNTLLGPLTPHHGISNLGSRRIKSFWGPSTRHSPQAPRSSWHLLDTAYAVLHAIDHVIIFHPILFLHQNSPPAEQLIIGAPYLHLCNLPACC